MWLAVVKRLNEPGITGLELKRLRLILMSLKGYAVVQADYYLRLRNLEEEIKEFHEHMVEEYEQERDQATTEEEKAQWQQRIDELEQDRPWDQPYEKASRKRVKQPSATPDNVSHAKTLESNNGIPSNQRHTPRDEIPRPQKHQEHFDLHAADRVRNSRPISRTSSQNHRRSLRIRQERLRICHRDGRSQNLQKA